MRKDRLQLLSCDSIDLLSFGKDLQILGYYLKTTYNIYGYEKVDEI